MHLDHVILIFLITANVAYLMILAGTSKSALAPRRARRICPSCGRLTRDCCCRG
jgi:hypothetical protein